MQIKPTGINNIPQHDDQEESINDQTEGSFLEQFQDSIALAEVSIAERLDPFIQAIKADINIKEREVLRLKRNRIQFFEQNANEIYSSDSDNLKIQLDLIYECRKVRDPVVHVFRTTHQIIFERDPNEPQPVTLPLSLADRRDRIADKLTLKCDDNNISRMDILTMSAILALSDNRLTDALLDKCAKNLVDTAAAYQAFSQSVYSSFAQMVHEAADIQLALLLNADRYTDALVKSVLASASKKLQQQKPEVLVRETQIGLHSFGH